MKWLNKRGQILLGLHATGQPGSSSTHTGNLNTLIKVQENNVIFLHAMKAHGKMKVWLQSVLTSAPHCGDWSASSLQPLYPWWKNPQGSLNRRMGGPQSQIRQCWIKPQFLGHPAHRPITIVTILHKTMPNIVSVNIYERSLEIPVSVAALHLAVRGLSIMSLQWNSNYSIFSF